MVEHLAYLLSGLPSAFVGQMAPLLAKYHRGPTGQTEMLLEAVLMQRLRDIWTAQSMDMCSQTVAMW